jgi:hypothetical protein
MSSLARVMLTPSGLQQHRSRRGIVDVVKPEIGSILYRYENPKRCKSLNGFGKSCESEKTSDNQGQSIDSQFVVTRISHKRRGDNKGIVDIAICSEIISIRRNQIYYNIPGFSFNIKLNNQAHWFNSDDLKRYTYSWDVPIESEPAPELDEIERSYVPDFVVRSPPMIIGAGELPDVGSPVILSPRTGIGSWEQPIRALSPPQLEY